MYEIRLQHLSVCTQHHKEGELMMCDKRKYYITKSFFKSVSLSIFCILDNVLPLVSHVATESVFDMFFSLQVNNRKYPKLKEVDDVLGGAAAWENVDSTAGK